MEAEDLEEAIVICLKICLLLHHSQGESKYHKIAEHNAKVRTAYFSN
jgi:hypothetical protein